MSGRALLGVAALLAVVGGCGAPAPATYVWVDVQPRPAVRGVTKLEVTVSEGGDKRIKTFGDGTSPVSLPSAFTVTPNQHRGTLSITATATMIDDQGEELILASGATTVEVVAGARADATLTLEPADFQVNSTIAGDQIVTDVYYGGRAGRQLAAGADGRFIVGFENSSLGRFDGMARLFDGDGAPRQNGTSMEAGDFILNAYGTESVYYVALAGARDGSFLATWSDYTGPTVVARRFDANGAGGQEVTVSASAAVVFGAGAAAAFADGSFVVVYAQQHAADASYDVRARLLDATGAPRLNATTHDDLDFPVGAPGAGSHEVPTVAVGQDGNFLVAWLDLDPTSSAGVIKLQQFSGDGAPGAELTVQPLSLFAPEGPNLAATPDGYLVVFADQPSGSATDDDVYVRFITSNGQLGQPAYRVNTSTDGVQREPALAVAADGSVLVAWTDGQARPEDTDPPSIRGRVLQRSGLPIGTDFGLNTTPGKAQSMPSVAAAANGAFVVSWQDDGASGPDHDLGGIRARLIYPELAPRTGLSGAVCPGGDGECTDGLVCVPDTDAAHCHQACTSGQVGQPCASGGACLSASATGASGPACIFR